MPSDRLHKRTGEEVLLRAFRIACRLPEDGVLLPNGLRPIFTGQESPIDSLSRLYFIYTRLSVTLRWRLIV